MSLRALWNRLKDARKTIQSPRPVATSTLVRMAYAVAQGHNSHPVTDLKRRRSITGNHPFAGDVRTARDNGLDFTFYRAKAGDTGVTVIHNGVVVLAHRKPSHGGLLRPSRLICSDQTDWQQQLCEAHRRQPRTPAADADRISFWYN